MSPSRNTRNSRNLCDAVYSSYKLLSVLAAASGSMVTGAVGRSFASSIEGHRVLDFDFLDAARQRSVPTRLYLPQTASQIHPVPLLVFSHGLGGSRFGYRYLGSHLAGAGIASLHPQHVGSDNALWWGNPISACTASSIRGRRL